MTIFHFSVASLLLAAVAPVSANSAAKADIRPRHELERLVWQGDAPAQDAFAAWLKAHAADRAFIARTLKNAGFRQHEERRAMCDAFTYSAPQDGVHWNRSASIIACVDEEPLVLLLRMFYRSGEKPSGPPIYIERKD